MNNTQLIYQKLEAFIRKYYTNKLIKGLFLFIGLGVCYFLITVLLEYLLWLKPLGRQILFWLFILVSAGLFFWFICQPLFKLFKLQNGLSYPQASKIIGQHFGDVQDKLLNFLQLDQTQEKSELLLASIDQKAADLKLVPFTKAIDFKKSFRFLPLAIIPLLIIAFFWISGHASILSDSISRVVQYKKEFVAPAPFYFQIEQSLQVQQGEDFTLQVTTQGKVIPEYVQIQMEDEVYFLQNEGQGKFTYTFKKPLSDITFNLSANEVRSLDYQLRVIPLPVITDFEMFLNYPAYLDRKSEVIKGSGNAQIPEGTSVTWRVKTQNTTNLEFKTDSISAPFIKSDNSYQLAKRIVKDVDYSIVSSNNFSAHHQQFTYKLSVIKDAYPNIQVSRLPDSLGVDYPLVVGEVSDDYGLTKLQVVYYDKSKPNQVFKKSLPIGKGVVDRFHYQFPEGISLIPGVSYEFYFEVFDNDALHHFKSSRSDVFSHYQLTEQEIQTQNLQEQSEHIQSLSEGIKQQQKQTRELEQLKNLEKEKNQLDFKDQKKIEDYLERQQQHDELMKNVAEKLKENLKQNQSTDKDKELLEKRLEKTQRELEKNSKLLEELKQLSEKLQKEELFKKMDQLRQQNKMQQKSLEQLVELTKRFYVEQKFNKLAEDLNKLSKEQDALSEKPITDSNLEKQKELNEKFDALQKEMNQLEKENDGLKSPMDLEMDKNEMDQIEDQMEQAKDNMQKQNSSKAKSNQKKAASKMKQLSSKMQASMMDMQGEELQEDIKVLRQILDNLLSFSFSQEDLMKRFKNTSRKSPAYATNLKSQHNLKTVFQHVDDSLFALSLRNPKIGEEITKDISDLQYNLDKSIEELAESNISKGTSHQQYVVTTANKLAESLSNIKENMQMELDGMMQGGKPKPGKSGQGDMQLPDIIKKQEEILDKMQKGMQEGQGKPGEKSGSKGQSGNQGGDGEEGDAESLYEIYKEQQDLRNALQRELDKQGLGGVGQNTSKQLQDLEKQLLNKGLDKSLERVIKNIKHELLKLQTAVKQQGEEDRRKSNFNTNNFNTTIKSLPTKVQDYLNSIEILNRDALPLHPVYNQKVQQYFNK